MKKCIGIVLIFSIVSGCVTRKNELDQYIGGAFEKGDD